MRRASLAVLVCVSAALIGGPGVAAARTQIVWAGGPPKFQNGLGKLYGAEANDFFPHSATINVGDTISWQGMSIDFHTVDIPGVGGKDLPLIIPRGTTVSGVTDAAGAPFWFNSLPNLGFNPLLFAPLGAATYNGSSRVSSGLPFSGKPFKVTFTKPGTYVYFCDVHYDMRGIIVVRPKGKKVPSAAQVRAQVARQVVRDGKVAKALLTSKVKKDTVSLGAAGKDDVEILAFFPAKLHVKAGTTVKFTMPRLTGETHTATFGPKSYLKPIAKSFGGPLPIDPRGVYPSSPFGNVLQLGPTTHGNGFVNTGPLDRDPSTPLFPGAKITFTAPGTYHFFCLIHPFMQGTIVVK